MKTRSNVHTLALAALAATILTPFNAQAWELRRLSSNFMNFDGSETATSATAVADCSSSPCRPGSPDGALFFRKTVHLPKGDNVIYITFHGQADVHDDAALMMSCRINGEFCNPGPQGASAGPAGWVTLQKLPFDKHDNSISTTWCVPVRPSRGKDSKEKKLDIDLKLASSGNGTVFFENAHIYIDSSENEGNDRCKAFALTADGVLPGETKAEVVRGRK